MLVLPPNPFAPFMSAVHLPSLLIESVLRTPAARLEHLPVLGQRLETVSTATDHLPPYLVPIPVLLALARRAPVLQ